MSNEMVRVSEAIGEILDQIVADYCEENRPLIPRQQRIEQILKIKGLAPFIFTEFIKKCWSSYKFINAGEDWDVEYLRVTKMSYHPVKIHKSYMLVKE